MTPQIFEAINLWKVIENFGSSQELISCTIFMNKMGNYCTYKRMEEDEVEEMRMNKEIN